MDPKRAMTGLAGYTADQWGLVTAAQANAVGVDGVTLARLVDAGLLDHVRRGVYAATPAPDDPLRALRAAWLQLNPTVPTWERPLIDPDGGVLSHGTAAHVHGLGDLLVGKFQFIVPRRRTTKHPDITFRRLPLPEDDVTKINGLPVTTPERTIADLLTDHVDGGHAGDMIYQAVGRGQVDSTSLARRIGRYAHRYGVPEHDGWALLNHLLEQAGREMPATGLIDDLRTLFMKAISSSPQLQADLARTVMNSPAMATILQRHGKSVE